jgi:predicted enzyme related to lactoylglutathione lyase
MPERTSYEPGTPSWVDLSTSDTDAAKRFYGEVFGWEAVDAGPVEETGGYAFFTLGGKRVAGVVPLMEGGAPMPVWSAYVSTDDADGVAARARENGATILAEPMDVMGAGRMTFLMHPATGTFGAWQPGQHAGAAVVNDPGTYSWSEILTRDVDGAKALGAAVFGWSYDDRDFGGSSYTVIMVGSDGVGGMAAFPPDVPEAAPAHWLNYFAVDDADATVAKIQALGGVLTMGPMEVEGVGKFAVVADPQGATFGVIRNA